MTVRTYAEIVPPPEPEREVVLHMTVEEAEALLALLQRSYQTPLVPVRQALVAVVSSDGWRVTPSSASNPSTVSYIIKKESSK